MQPWVSFWLLTSWGTKLAGDYYFVTGKWQLTIVSGNQAGHFTLLFRKINDQWVIVPITAADYSFHFRSGEE